MVEPDLIPKLKLSNKKDRIPFMQYYTLVSVFKQDNWICFEWHFFKRLQKITENVRFEDSVSNKNEGLYKSVCVFSIR